MKTVLHIIHLKMIFFRATSETFTGHYYTGKNDINRMLDQINKYAI